MSGRKLPASPPNAPPLPPAASGGAHVGAANKWATCAGRRGGCADGAKMAAILARPRGLATTCRGLICKRPALLVRPIKPLRDVLWRKLIDSGGASRKFRAAHSGGQWPGSTRGAAGLAPAGSGQPLGRSQWGQSSGRISGPWAPTAATSQSPYWIDSAPSAH